MSLIELVDNTRRDKKHYSFIFRFISEFTTK